MDTVSLESSAGNTILKKSSEVSHHVPTYKIAIRDTQDLVRDSHQRVSVALKKSCAYSHHEKPNLNNKNILGEMQPKMQNLEITHNVELDHLKNKMELLSKKVHMLEAKLNNNVKAPENLTSESVKEMRITANEEESEFKPNASSEIKDNVY